MDFRVIRGDIAQQEADVRFVAYADEEYETVRPVADDVTGK
jgi:hypothetical protein